MPLIQLSMLEGRTNEQKIRLIKELTRITCEICSCKPEAVVVILHDVPKENWGTAGKSKAESQ